MNQTSSKKRRGKNGGRKSISFKRRKESNIGNVMVEVMKRWKRKEEQMMDQQFAEMISRVLWGGTKENRVSWQHWGEIRAELLA